MCSDEIPGEIIHSNAKNKYYKVRKKWFIGICACLDNGLDSQEFTGTELKKEIETFVGYYTSDGFIRSKSLTTPEDIERANKLIDKIWALYGEEKQ